MSAQRRPRPSDAVIHYHKESARAYNIHRIARQLSGVDQVRNPTKYRRLAAELLAAQQSDTITPPRVIPLTTPPAETTPVMTQQAAEPVYRTETPPPTPEPQPSDPRAFYMDVTPAQARKWLSPEINSRNRKIIGNAVNFYSDAMEHGEWRITGDSLQFAGRIDSLCTLLNGQHRLEAIAHTGITQRLLIVDELDPDVFAVLDTGKPRGFKDVLSSMGAVDASKVAAGARLAYLVENGMTILGGNLKVSNLRLQEWITDNPEFAGHASEAGTLRNACTLNASAGMVSSWRLGKIDADASERFFHGIRTGANLDTGDARLTLRNWLERNGRRERGAVHLAMVYKAWNGWRAGKDVHMLRWNREGPHREAFPEPIT